MSIITIRVDSRKSNSLYQTAVAASRSIFRQSAEGPTSEVVETTLNTDQNEEDRYDILISKEGGVTTIEVSGENIFNLPAVSIADNLAGYFDNAKRFQEL